MSYILGFLYADGNVTKAQRGNCYIAFYTQDEELLVAIRKIINSHHKIALRTATSGNVYRLQIGSAMWFRDLAAHGLTPNKTKRISFPKIPKEFFGDFVRGYFDGDGNVWVGQIHKMRKTSHTTIQVSFTSGSIAFVRGLRGCLHQYGLQGGSIYVPQDKNFGRLTFSVHDALKLYEIMYNGARKPYLKRKKVVFDRFIKECGRGVAG